MLKKIIYTVLILVGCELILPIFIKSLRYDLINGGGNLSSSVSKDESIDRGVYLYDLELVSFKKSGDSVNFKLEQGWIEKMWRDGAWYWTTNVEGGGYSVIIKTNLKKEDEDKVIMTNNKKSAIGNFEGLGCRDGRCYGTIRELPDSDTIKYNLLKEDNINFGPENIIGEVSFIIKKIE